tara:strand:+ start:229 stop:978 length:750 start_codon:yes stop_codon:yes gene_type:complete
MADKDWGQGAVNNDVNWGKARFVSSLILPNAYGWGGIYEKTWTGDTNIIGVGQEMQKNDYYVYVLEQEGGNYLRGRIDGEWWLDNTFRVFNFFSGTVSSKSYTGRSYYGTADTGWVSIQANYNQSWWGCGFYNYTPAFNLALTNDYKFHIAFRATQNNTFKITLAGAGASIGSFLVGATGDPTNHTFDRDGEWHSIEVPLSELVSSGLSPVGVMNTNVNYLLIENATSGSGTFNLDMDAAYWYNTQGTF